MPKRINMARTSRDFLKLNVDGLKSVPLKNISSEKFFQNPIKDSFYIDQFSFPNGSMGIKTGMNDLIQSDEILQCAGLGIYDAASKEQFLAHIFNGTYVEDIADTLFEVFGKERDYKNLKISILPGLYKESKFTIKHILKALEQIDEELPANVNYVHFTKLGYDKLSMYQGKLFATDAVHPAACLNPESLYSFKNPLFTRFDSMAAAQKKYYILYGTKSLGTCAEQRIYRDFKKEVK